MTKWMADSKWWMRDCCSGSVRSVQMQPSQRVMYQYSDGGLDALYFSAEKVVDAYRDGGKRTAEFTFVDSHSSQKLCCVSLFACHYLCTQWNTNRSANLLVTSHMFLWTKVWIMAVSIPGVTVSMLGVWQLTGSPDCSVWCPRQCKMQSF